MFLICLYAYICPAGADGNVIVGIWSERTQKILNFDLHLSQRSRGYIIWVPWC